MSTLQERSLIRFGDGGLAVTIPVAWARYFGLKAGDRVTVITNGALKILPQKAKKRARLSMRRGGVEGCS